MDAAYRGLVPLHFFLGWIATALLARRPAIGVDPPRISARVRAGFAGIHVRYRLAGATLSQAVALSTRPTIVCP